MNPRYGPVKMVRWAVAVVGSAAVVLLLAEHWPHLLPYVPWALLAACPLMHIFMHHGKHHRHSSSPDTRSSRAQHPPLVQ